MVQYNSLTNLMFVGVQSRILIRSLSSLTAKYPKLASERRVWQKKKDTGFKTMLIAKKIRVQCENKIRALSSFGRALVLHSRGERFESARVHHTIKSQLQKAVILQYGGHTKYKNCFLCGRIRKLESYLANKLNNEEWSAS